MTRTFVVAKSEFLMLVRTKAFIIGMLLAPVLVGISIGFQVFAAGRTDTDDHAFAVIDRTGVLFETIARAAAAHNAEVGVGEARRGPYFLPERVAPGGGTPDDVKVDLSARVRKRDLFAFVDIPATVLSAGRSTAEQVDYYTQTPSYRTLIDWLGRVLGDEITSRRLQVASVDRALVTALMRPTRVTTLGLVDRQPDGTVSEARRENPIATFAVPFGLMYLLFIALMSSAPQLLTAVIEEKMSRISEVLIASISPFQLMMGKLVGVAAVSVLLAVVYLAGAIYAAMASAQLDLVQPALVGWFLVFLVCAVLIFGSTFIAVGAACSDLKDSQSMMQPVMLFLLMPLFVAPVILRAPGSTLSVVASLVPTATPFLMLLRLAMTPPPPAWQVALSVVLTLGTAVVFVWAAGKIFRVGLLMQGKAPNLPELFRWIRQ